MTDGAPSLMGRLRDLWWLFCCLAFVLGGISGLFVHFNVYYLAEQASILSLGALTDSAMSTAKHFLRIDDTLRDQGNTNESVAKSLKTLNDQVQTLDTRAEADRQKVLGSLTEQGKNTETILLLLQQKPPPAKDKK